MEEIVICGMQSPACVRVIESIVGSFPAVESVQVDFLAGIASLDYDMTQYSIETADSIALAIEKAGYLVACSHGVTIEYVLLDAVRNEEEAERVEKHFKSFDFVKRVYVDIYLNAAALFVAPYTKEKEFLDSLVDTNYTWTRAYRDVHIEISDKSVDFLHEADTASSQTVARHVYNCLKRYSILARKDEYFKVLNQNCRHQWAIQMRELDLFDESHSLVSAVYINVSLSPCCARIKGRLTLSEISDFLSTMGYTVVASEQQPLLPITTSSFNADGATQNICQRTSLASSSSPFEVDLFQNHLQGGFVQVPAKSESQNDYTHLKKGHRSVRTSTETVNSNSISSPSSSPFQTPPRHLGATPLTWKSKLNQKELNAYSPLVPEVLTPENSMQRRRSSDKSEIQEDERGTVVQYGHTGDLVASFSLEGEALRTSKIREIEDEIRRQYVLDLSSRPSHIPEELLHESVIAVYDVKVLLFEEKVEVLYDSSLLHWPSFVDSISRAGFKSSFLGVRCLNSKSDFRVRQFLLTCDSNHEDIQRDLFSGMSMLKSSGGVMDVQWIADTPDVRSDISTLLPGQATDIMLKGSFRVLKITYDSVVLPLFNIHEMLLKSSNNKLQIYTFPSHMFIHRHIMGKSSCDREYKALNSPRADSSPQSVEHFVSVLNRKMLIALFLSCSLILTTFFTPRLETFDVIGPNAYFEVAIWFEMFSFLLSSGLLLTATCVSTDTIASLGSWHHVRNNPYLLIGLGALISYAMGTISFVTTVIFHFLPEDDYSPDDLTAFYSMTPKAYHFADNYQVFALYVVSYLASLSFSARNHTKWISSSREDSSKPRRDRIEDLLAQTFLCLRPNLCNLLVVSYPGADTAQSKAGLQPDDPNGWGLRYQVVREQLVSPELLKRGDLIIVKKGDVMPIDGEIVRGSGVVEEGLLTGSSDGVDKCEGDCVLGGSTVLDCGSKGIHILVRCEVEYSILEQIFGLSLSSAAMKERRWKCLSHNQVEPTVEQNEQLENSMNSLDHSPYYQHFMLSSSWQLRFVTLYNVSILIVAAGIWVTWTLHGLVEMYDLSYKGKVDATLFTANLVMATGMATSVFVLSCPVMIGAILADALIIYLASRVSFARYGVLIQPARAVLRTMNQLCKVAWAKSGLLKPHLDMTGLYILSSFGSDLVLVNGQKVEGLDAVDQKCLQGYHSRSYSEEVSAEDFKDESNELEYFNKELLLYLIGAAQFPLRYERATAFAAVRYVQNYLPMEIKHPDHFEITSCGGIKCVVTPPPELTWCLPSGKESLTVTMGSLEFLRSERIRFAANSMFINMANLAMESHGAKVAFVATDSQVAGMIQFQHPLLPDAEVTIRALGARKVESWMFSGDPPRPNISLGHEVGISSLNIFSELFPHDKVRYLEHLQQDDAVVGFVVPSVDEVEGAGASRGASSLGKLLNSLPTLLGADVSVSWKSGHLSSQRAGQDPALEATSRLLELSSDIVLLASAHDPPGRASGLFGLVAATDMSKRVTKLLQRISFFETICGVVWLLLLLWLLHQDGTKTLHFALSSRGTHSPSAASFLLLCWSALHPPSTISARVMTVYLVGLIFFVCSVSFLYLMVYYSPPEQTSYFGLTRAGRSSDEEDVYNLAPPPPSLRKRTSSSRSDAFGYLEMESSLSFVSPSGDSSGGGGQWQSSKKANGGECYSRRYASDMLSDEQTPLNSDHTKQPYRSSYGTLGFSEGDNDV